MIDKFSKLKDSFWFSWYFLIFYYFLLRAIFGIEYLLIYSFVIFLIAIRLSFEKIALIFFIISLISYIFATVTEANHYMSFVYGFLVLSVLKNLYLVLK
ncbi:MAG: hypothetical protein ABH812_04205 [bacterium]